MKCCPKNKDGNLCDLPLDECGCICPHCKKIIESGCECELCPECKIHFDCEVMGSGYCSRCGYEVR